MFSPFPQGQRLELQCGLFLHIPTASQRPVDNAEEMGHAGKTQYTKRKFSLRSRGLIQKNKQTRTTKKNLCLILASNLIEAMETAGQSLARELPKGLHF